MLLTLAVRHLLVRPVRSSLLLLGFALGVGVMIVLLSVGEAMVDQARDVSLVGGGEITVLPEGIDIEALRTGGLGGMFFGIDRARYVTRVAIGGPRYEGLVRVVAPAIEDKLLYLALDGDTVPVMAGGEVPSRARAVGAGLDVLAGAWNDTPADSAWIAPTPEQLYHQLDHFHQPLADDSTWGEWHYFNLVTGPDEWWYLTLLVGGRVGRGEWGGQVLVTHRLPGGRYERFSRSVEPGQVRLDTASADLTVGESRVTQRGGRYHAEFHLGDGRRIGFELQPARHRYFPPVLLEEGGAPSGYTVPALRGLASGVICGRGGCREFSAAPGYHDHNWGVWRDVTWEWGAASGAVLDLLYGVVRAGRDAGNQESFFLTVVDSLGIRQILRGREVAFSGSQPAVNDPEVLAPERLALVAARDGDTVEVAVAVREALVTRMGAAGFARDFLQMRGKFTIRGRIAGEPVADSGNGFFETWLTGGPAAPSAVPLP